MTIVQIQSEDADKPPRYDTELVLFAEEAITNNSVSIAIVKTTGIAVYVLYSQPPSAPCAYVPAGSGFSVQLHNTTNDTDNFGTVIKNIEVTRGAVVRLYAIFIVLVICESFETGEEGAPY